VLLSSREDDVEGGSDACMPSKRVGKEWMEADEEEPELVRGGGAAWA
jgi:hypothetical protein